MASNSSSRPSSSSCSFRRLSYSRSLIRVPMSWFATAPREVSSVPSITRLARSSRSSCSPFVTLLVLPLPPLEAALWRFSALAGSCHQQYRSGGSTEAVHPSPLRLVPAHRAINYAPPYPWWAPRSWRASLPRPPAASGYEPLPGRLLGLGAFRLPLLTAPGFPEGGEVALPLAKPTHVFDVLH